MRATLIVAVTLVALVGVANAVMSAKGEPSLAEQFASFQKKFGKKYDTKEEEALRFKYFAANVHRAEGLNKLNAHATFGVTLFSDRSEEEMTASRAMVSKHLEGQLQAHAAAPKAPRGRSAPSKIDWRQHNAVTPVSNQGQCGGGCVAYTVVENVEGVNAVTNKVLTPLSAQEVVACAMGGEGCNGGFPSSAINWFLKHTDGKIVTQQSYPWNSSSGVSHQCEKYENFPVGAQVTSLVTIAKEESALVEETGTTGPIAVAVDATSFQLYTGGIMTNCQYQSLDHTLVVVGYNLENRPPYWILKNSWGASWGEQGYIRLEYGTNQCGIDMLATTVTVA